MSSTTRTLIVLATLIVAVAGCSGGGGGTPTTGAPPLGSTMSREDYASHLAEWLCDDLAACCESTQRPVDREGCITTKRAAELHRLASEEAHSGRVFDETVAATCVSRLSETPAECGAERRVKECFRTYDGLVELGEACVAKSQCRGSVSGDVACVGGVCTTRLAAGEACQELPDDTGRCDVCRGNARCREASDGSHSCYGYESRRGVAGDTCRSNFALPADPQTVSVVASCYLDDGLHCSSDGICEPLVAIGGACTIPFECERGARCVDGVCAPGLGVGETCRSVLRDCAGGLYCRWTSEERNEGHCDALAAAGEPCSRLIQCADGLACEGSSGPGSDGVCVSPEANFCTMGLQRLARQASAS